MQRLLGLCVLFSCKGQVAQQVVFNCNSIDSMWTLEPHQAGSPLQHVLPEKSTQTYLAINWPSLNEDMLKTCCAVSNEVTGSSTPARMQNMYVYT